MKSKSKRRKGLKAKKYNLGGYLNPTDPPKYESRASVPPRDYTLREYDKGGRIGLKKKRNSMIRPVKR
jgi:hypothetical protein